jgi:glycosyltransferase involved in cell wall biosynthesis
VSDRGALRSEDGEVPDGDHGTLGPGGPLTSADSRPAFAVVVPAYNEERGIERCVRAIDDVLGRLPNRTALIVVDDGSADRTGRILADLRTTISRLIVVAHDGNRGYGGALRTGARQAAAMSFDYVLFMDSDLTNDPRYVSDFARTMVGGYDLIKGSRYIAGGAVMGVPRRRRILSVVGNRVARTLYGLPVRDCTNGFRALRTSLFQRMDLRENGFAVIMEELYHAQRLAGTVCEIPCALSTRANGLRPSSFQYRPRVFWDYLKYPIRSALHRARRLAPGG